MAPLGALPVARALQWSGSTTRSADADWSNQWADARLHRARAAVDEAAEELRARRQRVLDANARRRDTAQRLAHNRGAAAAASERRLHASDAAVAEALRLLEARRYRFAALRSDIPLKADAERAAEAAAAREVAERTAERARVGARQQRAQRRWLSAVPGYAALTHGTGTRGRARGEGAAAGQRGPCLMQHRAG